MSDGIVRRNWWRTTAVKSWSSFDHLEPPRMTQLVYVILRSGFVMIVIQETWVYLECLHTSRGLFMLYFRKVFWSRRKIVIDMWNGWDNTSRQKASRFLQITNGDNEGDPGWNMWAYKMISSHSYTLLTICVKYKLLRHNISFFDGAKLHITSVFLALIPQFT